MMQSQTRDDLGARFPALVEHFVATIPYLKEISCYQYRWRLLAFLRYLKRISGKKESLLAIINEEIMAGYLKEMRRGYALETVLTRTRIITRFLSSLKKQGFLKENPLVGLQKEYPQKGLKGIVLALTGLSPQKSLESLRAPQRFASPLGPWMQKFLSLQRSQGRVYRTEEKILSRFDRFLRTYTEPPQKLSEVIFKDWFSLFVPSQTEHRYKNFMVVRHFCLYLRRIDPTAYVPDSVLSPSPPPTFLPHIYSHSEIAALLREAKKLRPSKYSPLRGEMFYLFIVLLYTTGMRLSEVLKLKLSDIDWEEASLCIRETKFFKSRLVPLSPSTTRELKAYLKLCQKSGLSTHPDSLIFQNALHQGPYSKSTIEEPFREILRYLGLKPARGYRGPRLHDLRHTFAVHRLEEWYRGGEDVSSKLGILSTYLGHVSIASTQRYLTMTTEILDQASQRFRGYFTTI